MHVVLDHHQGQAAARADALELRLQRLGLGRVETGGGLVEQEQPRLRHQRAHQLDPLLHAIGKAPDRRALVVAEPGVGERRARLRRASGCAGRD